MKKITPGCIGRNEGRIQNSGGMGLLPDQSKTPSIYKHLTKYQNNLLNIILPIDCTKISWGYLQKAKFCPKRVCMLHPHGQESNPWPVCTRFLVLQKEILQVCACKCSLVWCRTWCCLLLCVIPSHHLHS